MSYKEDAVLRREEFRGRRQADAGQTSMSFKSRNPGREIRWCQAAEENGGEMSAVEDPPLAHNEFLEIKNKDDD